MDIYINNYQKLLVTEYIEIKNEFENKNIKNDYKGTYDYYNNIILNYVILSHLFIKILINFGNFDEAEKEYKKRKELINELNSLDLLNVEINNSNFGYFFDKGKKEELEIPLNQSLYHNNEYEGNITEGIQPKYIEDKKKSKFKDQLIYNSPKYNIKSSYERLIQLENNKNSLLKLDLKKINSYNTNKHTNNLINSNLI